MSDLGLDVVEAREAFRELRRQQMVDYRPDTSGQPYDGYLTVTAPEVPEPASAIAWRECLAVHCADADLADALRPAHEVLADLAPDDLHALVMGLVDLRRANLASAGFGFNLSAMHLLGSSKILDQLPRAARERLGVAKLPSTPRYVVAAGPSEPDAVLLIENTTTFEMAVRHGLDRTLILLAAYGYGLNVHADGSTGWSLVDSVQRGGCEVLARTGKDHRLDWIFGHPRVYFWGDLDSEGLRIAVALRDRLPQLALSALYGPMRAMLNSRRTSHPYAISSAKPGQAKWVPIGDALVDELGRACLLRAVDQEAVDITSHRKLAARALQLVDLQPDAPGVEH